MKVVLGHHKHESQHTPRRPNEAHNLRKFWLMLIDRLLRIAGSYRSQCVLEIHVVYRPVLRLLPHPIYACGRAIVRRDFICVSDGMRPLQCVPDFDHRPTLHPVGETTSPLSCQLTIRQPISSG